MSTYVLSCLIMIIFCEKTEVRNSALSVYSVGRKRELHPRHAVMDRTIRIQLWLAFDLCAIDAFWKRVEGPTAEACS